MRRPVRPDLPLLPLLTLLTLSTLLLVLAASGCNSRDTGFALPADLTALLPPAPTAIVAAPGLGALDAALADLDARAGDEPLLPPAVRAQLDFAALLDQAVPGLTPLVDPARPLALAMVAPPPLSQDLGLILIVPLRDPRAELPALPEMFRSSLVHGRYLALSTAAAVAALDSVPALAQGLHPGVASVAVDLAGMIAQYRGVVEMGLGMMAMTPAQDPDAPAGGGTAMSPEEARALAGVVRGALDSARRLDLALDLADGELSLTGRLGLTAGAPLAPGPQPDFGAALALSGLLPAGADLLQVWAQDQSRELAFMREYYLAGIRKETAALPPEQAAAYEAWFTGYLDMMPRLGCPAAAAVDFGEDGIGLLAVLEAAEPDALAEALTTQMDLLGSAGLGLVFVPLEPAQAGGIAVQRWRVEFDDEALAAGLGAGASGALGTQQATQVLLVMGDLLPEVSLATAGARTVLGTTPAGGDFAGLLERVAGGGGKPD
ncbi:MAG: hypothetical protein IH621_09560, partial [Krumholzibacteria bacterium]|nr:hypothetical protein [Candidatus Krumholzibacteria bacterium]